MKRIGIYFVFIGLVLAIVSITTSYAQDDATAQGQSSPQPQLLQATPLSVSGSEPSQMMTGTSRAISVFGNNFTAETTVRLVGFGFLDTTFINSMSLRATVPANIQPGNYTVSISDVTNGTMNSPTSLQVLPVPATTAPITIPTIPPRQAPPTPVPGQPSLLVSSYEANRTQVSRGETVSFTVEVLNQGTRTAQGINVAIEPGGDFLPASTQATVTLADLAPGQRRLFVLDAVAASDASPGVANVNLGFSYRDSFGGTYSDTATLNVTIDGNVRRSQVTLTGYQTAPNPAQAGRNITVSVLLANTGSDTAQQVTLRIPVGVLLPGVRGNTFPLGDIDAGETLTASLPLVVASDATVGVQSQTVSLTYLQAGEQQQVDADITIDVAVPRPAAILLESYDIGQDSVQPGERFTLNATLRNIGDNAVTDALVSFNTIDGNGATRPNEDFAPIGAGGAIFLDRIETGDAVTSFSQEFLVNGNVESGVYSLPIRLAYLNPDGSEGQVTLNASIVVLVPPRLRFIADIPPPTTARIGQLVDFSVAALNIGRRDVNLMYATLSGEGIEVEGSNEVLLNVLRPGDDAFIDGAFMPVREGDGRLLITLYYLNDLNQEASFEQVYEFTVQPAPPPRPTQTPSETLTEVPQIPQAQTQSGGLPDDFIARLLLGLLGLGR